MVLHYEVTLTKPDQKGAKLKSHTLNSIILNQYGTGCATHGTRQMSVWKKSLYVGQSFVLFIFYTQWFHEHMAAHILSHYC